MRAFKAVVNRVLEPAGIEVRARPPSMRDLALRRPTGSAGWIMEFLGTQGIGKTTLVNALHQRLKGQWFFRSDLVQTGPPETRFEETERLYRDIYLSVIDDIQKRPPDPWRAISQLRQLGQVIGESLTIQTHDLPRGFILDEGVFKNFPRQVLDLASATPAPLWDRRAFVYLRFRDDETAVTRYQARAEERDSAGLPQRRKSDAEVRAAVEENRQLFDRIVETADRFGCPVLTIFCEDPFERNLARVMEFEAGLRARPRRATTP